MINNPYQSLTGYDTLYQEWLAAKKSKDFKRADEIREAFEYHHGLTIFAEGEMPVEHITVKPMKLSAFLKKFAKHSKDPEFKTRAARITETQDSAIHKLFPRYDGLTAEGGAGAWLC